MSTARSSEPATRRLVSAPRPAGAAAGPGLAGDPQRPLWIRVVAGGLIAAALVGVVALVGRNSRDSQLAVAGSAVNGLIAFASTSDDGSEQTDIYVVAPDGLCYWFGERQSS